MNSRASHVVNTGDVLNRWTNGRFLSTPHRAFNTADTPRCAIPFFFHPDEGTRIECLPTCADAANPPRFPVQTVGESMAWFRGQNYDHFWRRRRTRCSAWRSAPSCRCSIRW